MMQKKVMNESSDYQVALCGCRLTCNSAAWIYVTGFHVYHFCVKERKCDIGRKSLTFPGVSVGIVKIIFGERLKYCTRLLGKGYGDVALSGLTPRLNKAGAMCFQQMSGLWDFLKRHRGKIVTGAVIAGGAFVIQQTWRNYSPQFLNSGWNRDREYNQAQLDARRHYIYDTQNRTCNALIVDLLPSIAKRISSHFDVEALIEDLKNNKGLSKEQRIIQWQDIKVKAIGRMVAVAYAFSLITVTLKCQISILAAQLCSSLTKKEDDYWWNQYIPKNLKLGSSLMQSTTLQKCTVDAPIQQIFMKCCQFFLSSGLDDLMKSIETVCKAQLEELELKTPIDAERLKAILLNLKRRMDLLDCRHFSYLVVPKYANMNGFAVPNFCQLDMLLRRLVEMLESTKCKEVVSALIDFFLDAIVNFVNHHSTSPEMPMARILPLITDSFHILSRGGFDSPIQNILCSTELHSLSMHVFSLPPVELF
uniref:Peroxisomal biogenesis factor 3 n=1 Tax=Setaria digitata TaxID=48799 RepID=A0A915PSP7_9BILA